MTTPDHREQELQNALRGIADHVDVPGDFTHGAIARRRRDQRNRAVLTSVAAAAVLAVAVPTVWSAGRGAPAPAPAQTTSTEVPSPTTTARTQVPTTSATPSIPATTVTSSPADVATRDNTYALDDAIYVGAKRLGLEKGTVVESLAVLSNGGLVIQSHLSTGSSGSEMKILSPTGGFVRSLGDSGSYVVSPDGSRVMAKAGSDDTVVVYAADGAELARHADTRGTGRAPGTIYDPGAVVGDLAYFQGHEPTGSLELNVVTGATRKLPADLVAVSPDGTRAALQRFATDGTDHACWAVIDLTKPSFPKTVERCGTAENPNSFMPTAFSSSGRYLVGQNSLDGGSFFSAAVVRVSDGKPVIGGTGEEILPGWSWHLTDDETALVISRNTSSPLSPATKNAVQQCTFAMQCTEVRPELPTRGAAGSAEPRYVVPR